MDLLKAIKERRSVRKFERRPVSPEVLRRLVETACWAPTGGNRQTWRFVIVTDERRLAKLRMVSPGLIGEPPAAIVVCEDLGGSIEQLAESDASVSTSMDAPLAAYVITLAAHAEQLGSCIVASFNKTAVRRLLHLPEEVAPVLIVTVGYPAKTPNPPRRRTEGVCFWETYDG
ncbi:MAG: nitroreductase family protein [Thermoleophilia bacterium]